MCSRTQDGTRRRVRQFSCAPGPRAMVRISWFGTTAPGSTRRTWISYSSRFIAARRHATGTGLGLAITRGLLAAEGGRIWCETAPDGAAQFTIVLPSPVRALDAQAP